MGLGVGLGGQLRGSLNTGANSTVSYAAWFSARSGNEQFSAERSAGGRASVYFPEQRLEVAASYGRLLQGTNETSAAYMWWWESKDAGFRLRSEGHPREHAAGYWVEADYRPFRDQTGGENRALCGGLSRSSGCHRRFASTTWAATTFRHRTRSAPTLDLTTTFRATRGFSTSYSWAFFGKWRCEYMGDRHCVSIPDADVERTPKMNMKLLFPALLNVTLWAGGIMPVVQDEVQPAQHETKHDSKPGNAKASNSGQSEGGRVFAASVAVPQCSGKAFRPGLPGRVRHMRVRANRSRGRTRSAQVLQSVNDSA